jgi:hypothetical protein
LFRWECKLHAARQDPQTQLTHLPFGSGVSASFHQSHITERTAIHLVNPSDLPLDPRPDLGFTTWTVRALLTRVSLLTARAGRVYDSCYVETGNGASLGRLFLPFMRPPLHVARIDYVSFCRFRPGLYQSTELPDPECEFESSAICRNSLLADESLERSWFVLLRLSLVHLLLRLQLPQSALSSLSERIRSTRFSKPNGC